MSDLSSLCHSADLRLRSLRSSIARLSSASHSLQQQLTQSQHASQQHNSTLAHSHQQLCSLQHDYQLAAAAHLSTLHDLAASLNQLPTQPLLSALDEADDALTEAGQQWEEAAEAEWAEWNSNEAGVDEEESELRRLSAALELQYRESVHAKLQHLAAQRRYESAVQYAQRSPAAQRETDSEEQQSEVCTRTVH